MKSKKPKFKTGIFRRGMNKKKNNVRSRLGVLKIINFARARQADTVKFLEMSESIELTMIQHSYR